MMVKQFKYSNSRQLVNPCGIDFASRVDRVAHVLIWLNYLRYRDSKSD